MLHYILGGLLILIAIIVSFDIKESVVKDNESITPIESLILKEILRNRNIALGLFIALLMTYGLDLIFLR